MLRSLSRSKCGLRLIYSTINNWPTKRERQRAETKKIIFSSWTASIASVSNAFDLISRNSSHWRHWKCAVQWRYLLAIPFSWLLTLLMGVSFLVQELRSESSSQDIQACLDRRRVQFASRQTSSSSHRERFDIGSNSEWNLFSDVNNWLCFLSSDQSFVHCPQKNCSFVMERISMKEKAAEGSGLTTCNVTMKQ